MGSSKVTKPTEGCFKKFAEVSVLEPNLAKFSYGLSAPWLHHKNWHCCGWLWDAAKKI
jgi:hypothetical protein